MSATIPSGTELRRAALKRVEGYVCKDRQATHGDAEDNFRQIAAYWALYKGYPFTPGDVAAMMALVKIARMKTSPDYVDNWDDLAGYAICGAGLADKKRMSEPLKEPAPLILVTCRTCGCQIYEGDLRTTHSNGTSECSKCRPVDTTFYDYWRCNECRNTFTKSDTPWIRDNTIPDSPKFVCVKCGDPKFR